MLRSGVYRAGAATFWSALDGWSDGFGKDRLARRARKADDHLPRNAKVEADESAAEQAGFDGRSWRISQARSRAGCSPSGRATISPDWKLRSQRRPPTQVAEASCACMVGASARIALELAGARIGAGADHQRQVGHLVDWHAVENDAVGIDQREPLRSCHKAEGVRSTMSMTRVSGRRRETRASLTHPKRSSRSRIRVDVDQGLGGLGLARNSRPRGAARR